MNLFVESLLLFGLKGCRDLGLIGNVCRIRRKSLLLMDNVKEGMIGSFHVQLDVVSRIFSSLFGKYLQIPYSQCCRKAE